MSKSSNSAKIECLHSYLNQLNSDRLKKRKRTNKFNSDLNKVKSLYNLN